jgi:hypothetical protein
MPSTHPKSVKMNDAYIALQWHDEIKDTLYFAGFSNRCTRDVVRGKKAYVFQNDKFCLTIAGRSIKINDVVFKNVRDAKRHIQEML